MTSRVLVAVAAVAAVAAAVLIWAMVSPLLGLRGGQLSDPSSVGAPR